MVLRNHETFFRVLHRILYIVSYPMHFYSMLILFEVFILFDDAVVILLARLHGVRMS